MKNYITEQEREAINKIRTIYKKEAPEKEEILLTLGIAFMAGLEKGKGANQVEDKDYCIELGEEITEGELKMKTPEETKELFRFFVEHNSEKKVIEIYPINDNHITLYGVNDAEHFIQLIKDCIQTMSDN